MERSSGCHLSRSRCCCRSPCAAARRSRATRFVRKSGAAKRSSTSIRRSISVSARFARRWTMTLHAPRYIETLRRRGYRFLPPIETAAAGAPARVTRLIVLPFRMLRPDAETDFLAFSLPDAITASLSGLQSLVVRSSIAASRFGGDVPDPKRLAEEADVDAVLTGSLVRAGDQLRVSTQLTAVPAGTLLWCSDIAGVRWRAVPGAGRIDASHCRFARHSIDGVGSRHAHARRPVKRARVRLLPSREPAQSRSQAMGPPRATCICGRWPRTRATRRHGRGSDACTT